MMANNAISSEVQARRFASLDYGRRFGVCRA
jgi:hypothetical protein